MKVSEAIKLLESKVVRSEENLKHFPKESQGYAANEARIIAYNIAINKLEQIDEPQAEKVEVPEFVAEWIKENCHVGKYVCLERFMCQYNDVELPTDLYNYYDSNKDGARDKIISAILDGYTVKPKRWVVRQGGSEVWYLQGFRNSLDGDIVKQWCSHEGCIKFTDKSKAETVAVLVDGSVEEA